MKHLAVALSLLAIALSLVAIFRNAPAADAFEVAKIKNARAGIYGFCDAANQNLTIITKFNNVNKEPIYASTVGNPEIGYWCELSFPFKVTNHIMVATYGEDSSGFVSVSDTINGSPHPYDLSVTPYDSNGSKIAGHFYLILY